jgi:outer membrane protein TolC
MNITDINTTPLHKAFDEVCRCAAARGVRVTGTEIVGLVPKQTLIDAGSQVNTAMANIHAAKAKQTLLASQVQSLQQAVEATQDLMKNSNQVTYLNVLTAQSSLLGAQLNQVSNQFDIVSSTIDLYQALGGGVE